MLRLQHTNSNKSLSLTTGTLSTYSDPISQSQITVILYMESKADVYSYELMLLEILCSRRNMQVCLIEPEATVLSNWAYNCFVAGQLNKLFLSETADETVVKKMIKVALWCVQEEPAMRPTMKNVVLMLEGIADIAIC
ncbi:hypothetical protein Fmac_012819 [Flemingia macrophylla]|uniref:Uncharacterized protein n=1 Tax=Flemingia macrophylla TaxID=520843 RepID=A0ABD1MS84_9FABA